MMRKQAVRFSSEILCSAHWIKILSSQIMLWWWPQAILPPPPPLLIWEYEELSEAARSSDVIFIKELSHLVHISIIKSLYDNQGMLVSWFNADLSAQLSCSAVLTFHYRLVQWEERRHHQKTPSPPCPAGVLMKDLWELSRTGPASDSSGPSSANRRINTKIKHVEMKPVVSVKS